MCWYSNFARQNINNQINSTMKHLFKLVFFACLLAIQSVGAGAQTLPFSQIVRHNNITGTEVITRTTPSDMVLTCSKSVNGDGKHTFTMYSPSTGETRYFTCHLGELFSSASDNYMPCQNGATASHIGTMATRPTHAPSC